VYKAKAYSAASPTSPMASTTIPRRDPGERDVRLEILFCGICHSDLHSVRRRSFSGSNIGGIAETQEMLDFCGKHNITADVEVIPIQKVNEAYERLLKSDVKYRFSIEMASLKNE
jgi:D-arabinose 1-dehydrogenase-like Zn-dependent alcohol dehydrogenase